MDCKLTHLISASWDSPPQQGEKGYEAYLNAFERFVLSREVEIPKLSKAHLKQFDDRAHDEFRKKYMLKDPADLQLGQAPNLKLMPFQVDGFNWLCNNWWNHQQCILADEMGLVSTPLLPHKTNEEPSLGKNRTSGSFPGFHRR